MDTKNALRLSSYMNRIIYPHPSKLYSETTKSVFIQAVIIYGPDDFELSVHYNHYYNVLSLVLISNRNVAFYKY